MIKIKFSILGKQWTLRYMKRKEYREKNGKSSIAVTYVNERKIDLSPDGADKETVMHELVHAYLSELCTHSADLTSDELEEIFAELLSKRGREVLNLGARLTTKVKAAKRSLK